MPQVPAYDPQLVEAKWQERWVREHTNEPDLDRPRRPFYNLMMFPYPSAEGLHVGNMFAFTGADIYGRFKRLEGYDVLEPIGFDAFGIHSENYALSVGTHPAKLIPQNIETFRRQLRRFGGMFDWRHELSTTDPRYYKWTQWIFLQLFKAGIAFRKKAAVNWCPKDMSVVANEQVINGFCERHPDTKVEQRFLEQWFFKITRYAERLLENLDQLDWSDSTRTLQRNWNGRSEGAELIFETPAGAKIPVFTTRPDTVFGATYLVLAPEHPLVDQLTAEEQRREVNAYRREVLGRDLVSRRVGDKTKTGVFLGSYARNPATGEAIPIWIADYVLMEYGTGAIMAVPAHDTRDFEFATQFKLPIREVVRTGGGEPLPSVTEDGVLVSSGEFDGLACREAQRRIVAWLQAKGLATPQVQYRLHDWCISRQRYWGPPIPIIYCDRCGPVPVPERDLPVELPFIQDFRPDASGVSPLARHKEWYFMKCPRCGAQGRRETDVSDTLRMYLMFLGPFQEGGDFRDTSIIGVRRFLDKLWAVAHEAAALTPGASPGFPGSVVERKLHQTIKKVTTDTERLDYNTAISAMMEYLNTVRDEHVVARGAIEPLVVMVAPYAPHLAEELWSLFGHERSIFTAAWPAFDERLAAAGDVEVVVQVNGKVRGRVTVGRGASEAEVVALAMQDESVRKFVDGKPLRKTVYVQDRLLNLVV